MKFLSENVKPFVKFMMMIAVMMSCFSLAALTLSTLNYLSPELQQTRAGQLSLQAIASAIMFGLSTAIYIFLFDRGFSKQFCKPTNSHLWIWAIVLPLTCIPLVDWLNLWNDSLSFPQEEIWRQMQQNSSESVAKMLSTNSLTGLLGSILVFALVPAVFEELFFRGVLQRICTEWFQNALWGIVISSVIFSFVHFEIFSFVPRFVLSCMMGLLFAIGKSLWVNIAYHFVNNLANCLFHYLAAKGVIPQADSSLWSQQIWLIVLSTAIFTAFIAYIFILNKKSKKLNPNKQNAVSKN